MANGYMGKILKVDLTTKTIEEIPTSKYEEWGGGHGMGSAIFWDLCEDKTVKGDDPKNVITIMASPLSGTLAPAVAGRTEIQGIALQSWPRGWFSRSNFGGRFSTQLKFAGWDGIILTGKADGKYWINIIDGTVTLEDASDLWGLDTFETALAIYEKVLDTQSGWNELTDARDGGRTTQKPAVLSNGPNAETYAPVAALVHDAGNGAGQGGFGGVFALKGIKAISVLGTGGVEVADPQALMDARLWLQQYAFAGHNDGPGPGVGNWAMPSNPGTSGQFAGAPSRPAGCVACVKNCRGRSSTNQSHESTCVDGWYGIVHGGADATERMRTTDMAQRYGINTFILIGMLQYLTVLYKNGIIGEGKEIQSSLPFDQLSSGEFGAPLLDAIIHQTDIGADLALGLWQAAEKWGRLEEDKKTGWLSTDMWGYVHHYDGRTEAEWGYGSVLGDRDINEHDFNWITYWCPSIWAAYGVPPLVSAERLAEICTKKCPPYNDPMLIDYSDEGVYAESMAKLVAWHRHYTRYYKQALGFCDWAWADFLNPYGPDYEGATPEGEPKFFNAVTGKGQTFEEGMEIGRKIWNLDRAVWVLQGRHRDMEVFSDYMYDVGSVGTPNRGYAAIAFEMPYTMPVFEDGEWKYKNLAGRKLDRAKFEEWKTKYYTLEGWDTSTGWPTRKTLEELDLGNVADELEKNKKLGSV